MAVASKNSSKNSSRTASRPVTPPNAACPGRKLGRAKKLTGVKRGPTFESALVVSAPKGGEPDGMHRGSQVYQIAEEIDFSVGGRIMTRARGVRVDGEYIAGQTEVGPTNDAEKMVFSLLK